MDEWVVETVQQQRWAGGRAGWALPGHPAPSPPSPSLPLSPKAHLTSALLPPAPSPPPPAQATLFHSIKPLFSNKPVLIVANKTDVVKLEDLSGGWAPFSW